MLGGSVVEKSLICPKHFSQREIGICVPLSLENASFLVVSSFPLFFYFFAFISFFPRRPSFCLSFNVSGFIACVSACRIRFDDMGLHFLRSCVCVLRLNLLFLPVNIQDTHCPCRLFLLMIERYLVLDMRKLTFL